jgi:predicted transcriptional regulator
MTRSPVLVGTDVVAHVALRLAEAQRVHHLLVVEAGRLRGRTCVCDLETARPGALVSDLMRGPGVSVPPELGVAAAARAFQTEGEGCLPVIDGDGVLVGVVTGRDLRRAGALLREPGVDSCTSCGATHGLVSARGQPAFCAECVRVPPRESSAEWLYYTLGGSG